MSLVGKSLFHRWDGPGKVPRGMEGWTLHFGRLNYSWDARYTNNY